MSAAVGTQRANAGGRAVNNLFAKGSASRADLAQSWRAVHDDLFPGGRPPQPKPPWPTAAGDLTADVIVALLRVAGRT